jgi:hypothetical protein
MCLRRQLTTLNLGASQVCWAQTPLVRFVVELYKSKFTTNPQLFDKSITSRHVKMLWTLQQIHNKSKQWRLEYGIRLVHNKSKSCTTNPQLYDKSYIVQLVVQQIHNKSNKWSLSLRCLKPSADGAGRYVAAHRCRSSDRRQNMWVSFVRPWQASCQQCNTRSHTSDGRHMRQCRQRSHQKGIGIGQ